MKVFQINTVYNTGSTGRIVAQLKHAVEADSGECMAAYGRGTETDEKNTYRITPRWNVYLHALLTRFTDKTAFYSTRYTYKLCKKIRRFQPDVIHLHNMHGYYLNIEVLFRFLKKYNRPVIWTLHDCWAFTGHCAYFTEVRCEQWKNHCHNCIQKKRYPSSIIKDNCWNNFEKKKAAFTGLSNLTIITPSKWLAGLVSESFLRKYPIKVIHNGIDTNQFYWSNSNFRKTHHLENRFLLLGVANVWDERKGYKDFIKLSEKIDDSFCIVLVGLNDKQLRTLPSEIVGIKKTNSLEELAQIYSSADLFLNLTYEDNYPTVNLEAMACGTPVITYDSGGCAESIIPEMGLSVKTGDLNTVIEYIKKYKDNKDIFHFTKEDFARNMFGLNRVISEYCTVYDEVSQ